MKKARSSGALADCHVLNVFGIFFKALVGFLDRFDWRFRRKERLKQVRVAVDVSYEATRSDASGRVDVKPGP